MTIEELTEQQEQEQERQRGLENRICVCTRAGCISAGAEAVKKALPTP
jgi:NADH:ubiquinone oxidoreductase subunit E